MLTLLHSTITPCSIFVLLEIRKAMSPLSMSASDAVKADSLLSFHILLSFIFVRRLDVSWKTEICSVKIHYIPFLEKD